MLQTMTVRDFIAGDGDVDIVDDVCEKLYIAVCRPVCLTEEGEHEFADVLSYTVKYDEEIAKKYCSPAVLCIDDDDDSVWEGRLNKAIRFFHSAAGYCADSDWDKWFYLDDDPEAGMMKQGIDPGTGVTIL